MHLYLVEYNYLARCLNLSNFYFFCLVANNVLISVSIFQTVLFVIRIQGFPHCLVHLQHLSRCVFGLEKVTITVQYV